MASPNRGRMTQSGGGNPNQPGNQNRKVIIRNTYKYDMRSGGQMYVPQQSEPTVGGAIIGCITMLVLLIAVVVAVGPLIDYFANYIAIMPDNPYKQYSLEMFPWVYAFIVLGGVVAFALVWRIVIRNIVFDMKGEF